jgi:hypothetical protein
MYQKGDKYYADWRDQEGKRKRRSFPTALGAQRFENQQKAAKASNPSQAARRSAKSARPSAKANTSHARTSAARRRQPGKATA